ncbi:SigE family RNA polymerase sigma factor [Streptomyces sp. NPDC050264]|uniref:SigE family RNA polymerase sigma factor n=1 Tax=Streptomyces sp. NPDC050264 TaxID=3155038 RepID=UPI00341641F5
MRRPARRTEEIEEFMRTVSPALFRSALLVCGDHHLAEDLVQTTLGKVFVSWGRVRRADHPPAYVRAMLMRTYLSYARLHRASEKPMDELPEQAAGTHDPALRLTLVNALAELPPRDRAVVVLRYWEDRSVAQTAAELGLSQGNVRIRSMRALKSLRGALADEDDVLAGK